MIHLIFNPNCGGGRARQVMRELEPHLARLHPGHQVHTTTGPGDAIRMAGEAARAGASCVVAVGGDGTLHEVVNGVLNASETPPPVALIPGGRGSDFARGMGIPKDPLKALALLSAAPVPVDVGRVTLPGSSRYFVNIADAGLGGFCVELANRWRLPVSGAVTYLAASLWALLTYSGSAMRLTWDDKPENALEGRFLLVAVANSSHFGGGMHIAPGATPTDGVLDVVAIQEIGLLKLMGLAPGLYGGTIRENRWVKSFRCKSLKVESAEQVPLDLDGELAHGNPAHFEVLPGRLPFLLP